MGQMISNASNYMIVCVHRSATDRPTIAYYPLVMGFMNVCKDMKLSTGLRCFIKAENNSRMNGRWFTSYRGYSADPCMHAHTHKHRYMHSHWCSSVKIHLRRQRDNTRHHINKLYMQANDPLRSFLRNHCCQRGPHLNLRSQQGNWECTHTHLHEDSRTQIVSSVCSVSPQPCIMDFT